MRKARAAFASNFFSCAGYSIIDNIGFSTIEDGIKDCLKQKAQITVICSSDEEYETIVPEIFEKLNKQSIVVVAGNPKNLTEHFKAIGLKHFIYTGMNILESLQNFQNELNIK